jgi:hypothetical protein
MVKDALNLSVEKINGGQIFGELMHQIGLDLEKKWAERVEGQKRFKRRRIEAESWKFAQMYVSYRESLKVESVESEESEKVDHPPFDLYRKPFLEGGVIQDESQKGLVTEELSRLERLSESLSSCEVEKDFTLVVGAFEALPDEIEEAIALQDSQPKRKQLVEWHESSRFEQTIKAYGQMLAEAFDHGVEAIKAILKPWSVEERWEAFFELEEVAPEKMNRLVAIAPNWVNWCDG